jgi:UDP-2-acetamido-2-deoxy-ribo-hexuluronate aminotransferase
VQRKLSEAGIPTAIHYPKPLHRQPAYAQPDLQLPCAETAARRVMSLPMSADLSEAQQDAVIAALRQALSH